jgi:glycosyltransferase involved in cell wall biosynthesis
MKIVFTSFVRVPQYTDPHQWLERIGFFTGILEELAKRHEVHSIEQINYEGSMEKGSVHYHFLRPSLLRRSLYKFIRKLHPDIVVIQGLGFPIQLLLLKMVLGSKTKLYVQHRADRPGRLKSVFQRLADRFVTGYFFSSKALAYPWIKKTIISNEQKITEVMGISSVFHPVGIGDAANKIHVQGKPVYLWVGRLDENKDPLTLVTAFLQFNREFPFSKLYMIFQNGSLLDAVKKEIGKASNAGSIELAGKIENRELVFWYTSAQFIISTSHAESSGIAVCEAMSCGCIPILTDIPSFRQMTGEGQIGILFEPGNSMALYNSLKKSLSIDWEQQSPAVLDYFKNNLSFTAIAKRMNQRFTGDNDGK